MSDTSDTPDNKRYVIFHPADKEEADHFYGVLHGILISLGNEFLPVPKDISLTSDVGFCFDVWDGPSSADAIDFWPQIMRKPDRHDSNEFYHTHELDEALAFLRGDKEPLPADPVSTYEVGCSVVTVQGGRVTIYSDPDHPGVEVDERVLAVLARLYGAGDAYPLPLTQQNERMMTAHIADHDGCLVVDDEHVYPSTVRAILSDWLDQTDKDLSYGPH